MQEILVQKEPATYDFWPFHVYPHMKCKSREKVASSAEKPVFAVIARKSWPLLKSSFFRHLCMELWIKLGQNSDFCDFCAYGPFMRVYAPSPAHVPAHNAHAAARRLRLTPPRFGAQGCLSGEHTQARRAQGSAARRAKPDKKEAEHGPKGQRRQNIADFPISIQNSQFHSESRTL